MSAARGAWVWKKKEDQVAKKKKRVSFADPIATVLTPPSLVIIDDSAHFISGNRSAHDFMTLSPVFDVMLHVESRSTVPRADNKKEGNMDALVMHPEADVQFGPEKRDKGMQMGDNSGVTVTATTTKEVPSKDSEQGIQKAATIVIHPLAGDQFDSMAQTELQEVDTLTSPMFPAVTIMEEAVQQAMIETMKMIEGEAHLQHANAVSNQHSPNTPALTSIKLALRRHVILM